MYHGWNIRRYSRVPAAFVSTRQQYQNAGIPHYSRYGSTAARLQTMYKLLSYEYFVEPMDLGFMSHDSWDNWNVIFIRCARSRSYQHHIRKIQTE